jgi:hypothetical protein
VAAPTVPNDPYLSASLTSVPSVYLYNTLIGLDLPFSDSVVKEGYKKMSNNNEKDGWFADRACKRRKVCVCTRDTGGTAVESCKEDATAPVLPEQLGGHHLSR